MAVDFNVNQYVEVRLTPRGRALHYELWQTFHERHPQVFERYTPLTEVDGWSRWQLWQLMQMYGPHLSMGGDPPFEMDIRILDEFK